MLKPQGDKRIAQEEERYRALAELSPDGVCIHAAGRFVYANSAAAALFGHPSAQAMLGGDVLGAVHPASRAQAAARLERLYAGNKAPLVEMRFLRRDGVTLDVEIAAVPLAYEGRPAALSLFRDVTGRKRMLEALASRDLELTLAHERRRLAAEAVDSHAWEWDFAAGRIAWLASPERLLGSLI